MIRKSNTEIKKRMFEGDLVLQALSEALSLTDLGTLKSTLQAIEHLLFIDSIKAISELQITNGTEKIEQLAYHQNNEISTKAKEIWDEYFYVPSNAEYQLENEDKLK